MCPLTVDTPDANPEKAGCNELAIYPTPDRVERNVSQAPESTTASVTDSTAPGNFSKASPTPSATDPINGDSRSSTATSSLARPLTNVLLIVSHDPAKVFETFSAPSNRAGNHVPASPDMASSTCSRSIAPADAIACASGTSTPSTSAKAS